MEQLELYQRRKSVLVNGIRWHRYAGAGNGPTIIGLSWDWEVVWARLGGVAIGRGWDWGRLLFVILEETRLEDCRRRQKMLVLGRATAVAVAVVIVIG